MKTRRGTVRLFDNISHRMLLTLLMLLSRSDVSMSSREDIRHSMDQSSESDDSSWYLGLEDYLRQTKRTSRKHHHKYYLVGLGTGLQYVMELDEAVVDIKRDDAAGRRAPHRPARRGDRRGRPIVGGGTIARETNKMMNRPNYEEVSSGHDYFLDDVLFDFTKEKMSRLENTTHCEAMIGKKLTDCLTDEDIRNGCHIALEEYITNKNAKKECKKPTCKYKWTENIDSCCHALWCNQDIGKAEVSTASVLEDVKKEFAEITQTMNGGELTKPVYVDESERSCEDWCKTIQMDCFAFRTKFSNIDIKKITEDYDAQSQCSMKKHKGGKIWRCDITPHCPKIKDNWQTVIKNRKKIMVPTVVGDQNAWVVFPTKNGECQASKIQKLMKKVPNYNERRCEGTKQVQFKRFSIDDRNFCISTHLCLDKKGKEGRRFSEAGRKGKAKEISHEEPMTNVEYMMDNVANVSQSGERVSKVKSTKKPELSYDKDEESKRNVNLKKFYGTRLSK